MGDASYAVNSFLGGEISLFAQGRWDKPDYKQSLNISLNGFPVEIGPWVRRPGSQNAGFTLGGAAGRVIKWDFEQASPYTMEFTANNLRFRQGAALVSNNDSQSVIAISSANPAVVNVAAAWPTGSNIMFANLGTTCPLLQNREFTVTNIDSTHASLQDAITGANIDGSTLGVGSLSANATAFSIQTLATPYDDTMWPTLRSVQAETQAVLLQTSIAPQSLEATPPASNAPATFTITPAQFVDGPYLDPVVGATLTPASVTGIVGLTMQSPTWSSTAAYNDGDFVVFSSQAYQSLIDQNVDNEPDTSAFAWQAVDQDVVIGANGLQPSDIGRHIRLFSEPPVWASGTTYAAGDTVKYNLQYWISLAGSNIGNIPGGNISKWSIATNATRWSWGTITSLTGAAATLIDPTTGTAFTGGGTFLFPARAFDGVLFKPYTECAFKIGGGNELASTDYSIGKNYTGGAQAVSYVIVNAPSNRPFVNWFGVTGALTLKLRGKSSAPANPTDGTLLGTLTVKNVVAESVQIFSSDTATDWNYLWVEFTATQGLVNIFCSQVQFFQSSPFSGTGISVQLRGPDLLYTTAINTWRLGLFTQATGYPTCGTYHESRLWIGGVADNRFDASALTDIFDNPAASLFYFTPTIQDGTVSDDCAISYTLDGPDVNSIFWFEPDHQGIIVGTQAGEWLVQASANNNVLTPTSIQAHRVTRIGGAFVEPRRTEHTLLFVQRGQMKLMEYFSDVFSGKFTAPNLADKAEHIVRAGIDEIAYQQATTPIVWGRCGDGSLFGMTYKRDTLMTSTGPTFYAWHPHTLGSGRIVESLCVGPSVGGNLDALTMVTSDGTTRHVEVLTDTMDELTELADSWFLDDAVVPSSFTLTGTAQAGAPYGGATLNGLWHLNGSTVTVFASGLDCGDYAVSNGSVFVPFGDGVSAGTGLGLFTQVFANTANFVVGFTYASQGQIVRPQTPLETGARNGPALGKKRRVQQVAALLSNTGMSVNGGGQSAISFGTSFSTLKPAIFQQPNKTPYTPLQTWDGVWWDTIGDESSFDGMVCWQITRPLPANVVAIEPFLHSQDK